jgi:hypothetical protein
LLSGVQLPVLFRDICMPGFGHKPPPPFPTEAMEWVRSMKFLFIIVDVSSKYAPGTQTCRAQQLGLLSFLPNLREIRLSIVLWKRVALARLNPSLSILQTAIRSIANHGLHTSLQVDIKQRTERTTYDTDVLSILPSVFTALQDVPLAKLSLDGILAHMATGHNFSRDQAYQSFRKVARKVQAFEMPALCWLALCPNPASMPMLTDPEHQLRQGRALFKR